ncbi:hypothetical protein D3C71_1551790 [compost metagenome]
MLMSLYIWSKEPQCGKLMDNFTQRAHSISFIHDLVNVTVLVLIILGHVGSGGSSFVIRCSMVIGSDWMMLNAKYLHNGYIAVLVFSWLARKS